MRTPFVVPTIFEGCGPIRLDNHDLWQLSMLGRDAVDLNLLCAGAGTKTEQKHDG